MHVETSPLNINDHLHTLMFGILLVLCSSFLALSMGFFNFKKENEWNKSHPIYFFECFWAFTVFLFMGFVMSPLLFYAALWMKGEKRVKTEVFQLTELEQGWFYLISILLTGLGVGVYLLILSKRTQQSVWGKNAFLSFRRSCKDLLFGSMTWFISFPVVLTLTEILIIILILNFHRIPQQQVAVKYLQNTFIHPFLYWSLAILIIVFVPIIEEILFRGFLQSFLKNILNTWQAIILTAIIFSFFHFSVSQGLDNIEILSALFILACFLGYIRERQQSLWAPIGLHGTFNAFSVVMLLHKS